jgi:enamine deaminase RidA (YjgF/YER057c/UK114 family)
MAARGRFILTAGVVGWNEQEKFAETTLAAQFAQALRNIVAILACDGAGPKNIARLTCYVTSIEDYRASLKEIGAAWREIMGEHYPAMALVEVVRLVEPNAKVEIEATAVVPE